MLTLSAFADEAAASVEEQISAVKTQRIYHIEVRGLNGKNVLDLDPHERETARALFEAAGIRVSAIGSPIGKVRITDGFAPHFERYQRAVEVAREFGTRYVRLFSFYVGEDPAAHRSEVLRRFDRLVKYAEEQDVVLLHENEVGVFGDTPERCRDLLEHFDTPYLRAILDVANCVATAVDPLDEMYEAVKPFVVHLHVKDMHREARQVVPAGEGDGRWRELLERLLRDGFEGFATLEPHLFKADQHAPEERLALFGKAADGFRRVCEESGVPCETVNFGILGWGHISRRHAAAIQRIPNARLEAVWSRSSKEERLGAARVFTSREDLLASSSVDAVVVATPSGLHAESACAAAEAHKHVLVEKPLDVTLEKMHSIHRAVESAGVVGGVISQFRFGAGMQELRRAVDEGRLGKLVLGDAYVKWYRHQKYYDSGEWRGTWALDGGGALMNQSIHYVDLLLWIMGEVESVQAQMGTLAHDPLEVEDAVSAVVRFKNGGIGVIQGTTAAYPGWPPRVEIHGTKGSMIVENDRAVFRAFMEEGEQSERGAAVPPVSDSGPPKTKEEAEEIKVRMMRDQIASFVRAVLRGETPPVSLRDGWQAVQLVLAVYESARTGKLVRPDEMQPAG
jgi:predicted dehydrogenase/sugar phosphate isomerase/epimerase